MAPTGALSPCGVALLTWSGEYPAYENSIERCIDSGWYKHAYASLICSPGCLAARHYVKYHLTSLGFREEAWHCAVMCSRCLNKSHRLLKLWVDNTIHGTELYAAINRFCPTRRQFFPCPRNIVASCVKMLSGIQEINIVILVGEGVGGELFFFFSLTQALSLAPSNQYFKNTTCCKYALLKCRPCPHLLLSPTLLSLDFVCGREWFVWACGGGGGVFLWIPFKHPTLINRLHISTVWEVFHLCHALCEWMKRHTCHLTVNTHSCAFRHCWRQACRNLCVCVCFFLVIWFGHSIVWRVQAHTHTDTHIHQHLSTFNTPVCSWQKCFTDFIVSLLVTQLMFYLPLSLSYWLMLY